MTFLASSLIFYTFFLLVALSLAGAFRLSGTRTAEGHGSIDKRVTLSGAGDLLNIGDLKYEYHKERSTPDSG